MAAEPYETVTSRASRLTGASQLVPGEAEALLALAKAVADSCGDRRAAPLTCYLAGQMLAGEADGGVRIERIQALAAELRVPGEQ
jgi:hypothetical protein